MLPTREDYSDRTGEALDVGEFGQTFSVSAPYLIRERRREDFPALETALYAQQPATQYPLRNPLPITVAEFLHADDAIAAWTAEIDGVPAGHGCHVGPLRRGPVSTELNEVAASAHGCPTEHLTWVSSLFVATERRGLGLGRALLETIVADARARGLRLCLEVYPVHPAAPALYADAGWQAIHRARPEWLRNAKGEEGPDVVIMILPEPAPEATR